MAKGLRRWLTTARSAVRKRSTLPKPQSIARWSHYNEAQRRPECRGQRSTGVLQAKASADGYSAPTSLQVMRQAGLGASGSPLFPDCLTLLTVARPHPSAAKDVSRAPERHPREDGSGRHSVFHPTSHESSGITTCMRVRMLLRDQRRCGTSSTCMSKPDRPKRKKGGAFPRGCRVLGSCQRGSAKAC